MTIHWRLELTEEVTRLMLLQGDGHVQLIHYCGLSVIYKGARTLLSRRRPMLLP